MVPRIVLAAGLSRGQRAFLCVPLLAAACGVVLAPHRAEALQPSEAHAGGPAAAGDTKLNFASMADLTRSLFSFVAKPGAPPQADPPAAGAHAAPHPSSATPGPDDTGDASAAKAAGPARAGGIEAASRGDRLVVKTAAPAPQTLQGDDQRTRFIIRLAKRSDFQVFALTSPNRVIVELADVPMELPQEPKGAAVGLVKAFRGGIAGPGKARVVIDVVSPVVVEDATMMTGPRGAELALDIVPIGKGLRADRKSPLGKASGLGAAGLQPPMPRKAGSLKEYRESLFKPVIVIDPGHGGHDTGAQKNGAVEKNVVLAFSLKLRDRLIETGRYTVLMTREDDRFIALDERRDFGERNKAALFIAVHADYSGENSSARGATIYSLRDSVAERLRSSARQEIAGEVLSDREMRTLRNTSIDVQAVQGILSDLARREVDFTAERTSVFTKAVIAKMGTETELRSRPDQSAAFAVLRSAKVPSVLIELGYVTNRQDAELLKSDTWREKVSGTIVSAIDNYFSHTISKLPM